MLAHEGHQGMVRTKVRLREKVWWPKMDKQVEDAIRSCHPCQLVGPRARPEPVRSSSLPDGPWKEISVDLLEISNGGCRLLFSLARGHSPEEDGCTTCAKEYGSYFQNTWITRRSSQ